MSLVGDDSLSLAGLDVPDFLQFNNSFASSTPTSSLTAHCHSSCATPTCMRDSSRGSKKYPQLSSVATTEEDPSSSSLSHSSDIFRPLPPIPNVSSFHLSVIWNRLSVPHSHPNPSSTVITRKSSLSDSSIGATDGNHAGDGAGVTEVPEPTRVVHVSTNPYSPWPSPIRQHFMSRSDGSFSRASRYSRPESRSGARAPDPSSRRTSLITIGCHFPGVRRVRRFTRNVRLFTRRMYSLKTLLRRVHPRRSVITPTPTTSLPRRTSTRFSRSSLVASFTQGRSLRTSTSSAFTNTLQRWLEARNGLTHERSSGHVSITISQYERRGSWLSDDWCDIRHRDVHLSQSQSPGKSTFDQSVSSTCTEPPAGKYVSLSLKAGEEASRRRKRSSNHNVTLPQLEFDSD